MDAYELLFKMRLFLLGRIGIDEFDLEEGGCEHSLKEIQRRIDHATELLNEVTFAIEKLN